MPLATLPLSISLLVYLVLLIFPCLAVLLKVGHHEEDWPIDSSIGASIPHLTPADQSMFEIARVESERLP